MADLLQGVKDGVVAGSGDAPDEFKMPSTEELLAAIEKMGLTEEQKKEVLAGFLTRQQEGGDAGLPGLGTLPGGPAAVKGTSVEIAWMLSLLSIVFLVLGKTH